MLLIFSVLDVVTAYFETICMRGVDSRAKAIDKARELKLI